jgi:biotin carboxyl carrier protein
MTVDIEVCGRVLSVSLQPIAVSAAGGRFRITIADRSPAAGAEVNSLELDVRQTALGVSAIDIARGRLFDAVTTAGAGGQVLVQLPGLDLGVLVDGRRFRRPGSDSGAAGTDGELHIMAPMPGRIVRTLVAPGDAVEARQPLLVIEAMKMENELRSPRAGRVRELLVTEGVPVESGRMLVILD